MMIGNKGGGEGSRSESELCLKKRTALAALERFSVGRSIPFPNALLTNNLYVHQPV